MIRYKTQNTLYYRAYRDTEDGREKIGSYSDHLTIEGLYDEINERGLLQGLEEVIILPIVLMETVEIIEESTEVDDNEVWKLVENELPKENGYYLVGRNRNDPHKALGAYIESLGGFINSNSMTRVDTHVYCWADVGEIVV